MWLLAVILVACANRVSLPIRARLEAHARPPITLPDRAPYPVSTFVPSTLVKTRLLEANDLWTYAWDFTTPASAREVVEYYNHVRPEALLPLEETDPTRAAQAPRVFEYVPTGASPMERVRIEIRPGEVGAHIRIREFKQGSIFVPDLISIRLVLYAGIALLFAFLRTGVLKRVVRFPAEQKITRACTQYRRVSRATSEPQVLARWQTWQDDLARQGFAHAGEYTMYRAGTHHNARLLQRRMRTWASLVHMSLDGGHHHSCELFTRFSDGSSVTTTNARFPNSLKRPSLHPLHIVPPGTTVTELVPLHEASVMRHVSVQRRDVDTLPGVDDLIQGWRLLERTLYMYRKKAGLPLEEPHLRLFASGAMASPAASAIPVHSEHLLVPDSTGSEEAKEDFRHQVMEALRRGIRGITLVERGPLLLEGQHGGWQDAIDLENLYTVCRHMPTQQSTLIEVFVRRLSDSMQAK